MRDLPDEVRSRPLNMVAIPASHDCFAWYLNNTGAFAQNTDQAIIDIVNRFSHTEGIAKRITKIWGETQLMDIEAQLAIGVRYLDLRIMPRVDYTDRPFFTAHSLYAQSLRSIFEAVRGFVKEAEDEVVFLDMNHFYDMTSQDHTAYHELIEEVLGGYICYAPDNSGIIPRLTLNDFKGKQRRVLIFYDNGSYAPYFQNNQMVSPWPAATSPATAISALTQNLETGRPDTEQLYVSQCVMTPDGEAIMKTPLKGLRRWEYAIETPLHDWLSKQHTNDRVHGVNFILKDYMTEDWVKQIVGLNFQVLT